MKPPRNYKKDPVLKYLAGEDEVCRAADAMCDAALLLVRARVAVGEASAALRSAIAAAGAPPSRQVDLVPLFMYSHHRYCLRRECSHAAERENGAEDER